MGNSITDQLVRLAELRSSGALTDAEFTEAKQRLLAGVEAPDSSVTSQAAGPAPPAPPTTEEPATARPSRRANRLAVTSFVLGLASIVGYLIGIVPILALAFGVAGLATFNAERHHGLWMAIVGTGLGGLYTVAYLVAYGHLA